MKNFDNTFFTYVVIEIVKTIPYGRATSYGAIAKAAGFPNMSRMVGKVLSNCDSATNNIPAHRVVNSKGELSGRESFGSSHEMEHLLAKEGIIVCYNKIKNWAKVFWDPISEIQL